MSAATSDLYLDAILFVISATILLCNMKIFKVNEETVDAVLHEESESGSVDIILRNIIKKSA